MEFFGTSISLNYDGSRLAVRIPYRSHDDIAKPPGSVELYEYAESAKADGIGSARK